MAYAWHLSLPLLLLELPFLTFSLTCPPILQHPFVIPLFLASFPYFPSLLPSLSHHDFNFCHCLLVKQRFFRVFIIKGFFVVICGILLISLGLSLFGSLNLFPLDPFPKFRSELIRYFSPF